MGKGWVGADEDRVVKIFFNAPASFRDALHQAARARAMNLSSFIRMVLAKEIGWKPTPFPRR